MSRRSYALFKNENSKFLCIKALEDATTITIAGSNISLSNYKFYISYDEKTWTNWPGIVTLNSGQKLYIKGDNPNGTATATNRFLKFTISKTVEMSGNAVALIGENATAVPNYGLVGIFSSCKLTTGPDIIADSIGAYGCYNMFKSSTIEIAGNMPARTIAFNAYAYTYSNCTALLNGPAELPVETVPSFGCEGMFESCVSLEESSEIKASTINNYGLYNMYLNCTSLKKITTHCITWSASTAPDWVRGVHSTGDFYCPTDSTIPVGNNGIPSGWTRHSI